VDIEDVVSAHLLAAGNAASLGFDRFIISATTPFTQSDLAELRNNAPAVVERIVPDYKAVYATLGWAMFPEIDRVYVNARALSVLGWQPRYDFLHVLHALSQGIDARSLLAQEIGSKGYHRV
jgi:UDP-glucose 4-epimerase